MTQQTDIQKRIDNYIIQQKINDPQVLRKIDLSNLKINYRYKNWKEVFEDLGLKYQSGPPSEKNKNLIMKNTNYSKSGNSIEFSSLKTNEIPITKQINKKIPLSDYVALTLSVILSQAECNPVALTKRYWYELLGMANSHWKPYDENSRDQLLSTIDERFNNYEEYQDEHSEDAIINLDFFYRNTTSSFDHAFQSACTKLTNKHAIFKTERYGAYRLTPESQQKVLEALESGKIRSVYDNKIKKDYSFVMLEEKEELRKYLLIQKKLLEKYNVKYVTELNQEDRDQFYYDLDRLILKNLGLIGLSSYIVIVSQDQQCEDIAKRMISDSDLRKFIQGKFKEAHKQRTLSKHNDSLNKVIKKDVKSAVEEEQFLQYCESQSKKSYLLPDIPDENNYQYVQTKKYLDRLEKSREIEDYVNDACVTKADKVYSNESFVKIQEFLQHTTMSLNELVCSYAFERGMSNGKKLKHLLEKTEDGILYKDEIEDIDF